MRGKESAKLSNRIELEKESVLFSLLFVRFLFPCFFIGEDNLNACWKREKHVQLRWPVHRHYGLLRNWSEPHHMNFAVKTSRKTPFQDAVIGKSDFINISAVVGNAAECYVLDFPA